MEDENKISGRIPTEDLQNWIQDLEQAGLQSEDIGKFFYDHLKRNIKEYLKEGESVEWVSKIAIDEGEKMLRRSLSETEKLDLRKRISKFKENMDKK
jgi:hypothetical protein